MRHCNGQPSSGVVRFAKPHGSITWNLRNLGENLFDGEPSYDSLIADSLEQRTVEPLLLGAVPIKSELIREVQEYHDVPRAFQIVLAQWRAVQSAISDVNKLVVLGYSFPSEDTYGRFFFREGMLARQGRPLRVEYYATRESANKIGGSILEALPGELHIEYKGKVTPACGHTS